MLIQDFLNQLETAPDSVEFEDVMAVIETNYLFTPSSFCNAGLTNLASENMGSCKIFAFGTMHQLSEEKTLACFGKFYRTDVLLHPDANNHQNIRSFISNGWSGIEFPEDSRILTPIL